MIKKCFIAILVVCSIQLSAQDFNTPTLSPRSTIEQELGLTSITISYSRPSARDRVVFGNLVPYGQIWRTGANAATTIAFEEAARIGGNPIKAGTYALYTIPGKQEWTVIIHANTQMRSLAGDAYKTENDVFRFDVKPHHIDRKVETFTINIADITSQSCQLQISWENTMIHIPIEVEVDQKIEAQLQAILVNPDTAPHRTFFEAAQYYLHDNQDLTLSLKWINMALNKSPENFRYGLLKAKIQYASGDKKESLITINQAHTWAVNAKNANYIEQTDIFRKQILKG